MQPENLRCLNIGAAIVSLSQNRAKIYFLNQRSAFASLYSQLTNFKAAQDIYKQLLIMLSINGTNTTIMINPVL